MLHRMLLPLGHLVSLCVVFCGFFERLDGVCFVSPNGNTTHLSDFPDVCHHRCLLIEVMLHGIPQVESVKCYHDGQKNLFNFNNTIATKHYHCV